MKKLIGAAYNLKNELLQVKTVIVTLESIDDGIYNVTIKIKCKFHSITKQRYFTKRLLNNYLKDIRQYAAGNGQEVIYREKKPKRTKVQQVINVLLKNN